LLALAILFFALSFVFNSTRVRVSSVSHERKSLTNYIIRFEKDFLEIVKDTALLRNLITQEQSFDDFTSIEEKKYGIFLFAESISSQQMLFWNTQTIVPPST